MCNFNAHVNTRAYRQKAKKKKIESSFTMRTFNLYYTYRVYEDFFFSVLLLCIDIILKFNLGIYIWKRFLSKLCNKWNFRKSLDFVIGRYICFKNTWCITHEKKNLLTVRYFSQSDCFEVTHLSCLFCNLITKHLPANAILF